MLISRLFQCVRYKDGETNKLVVQYGQKKSSLFFPFVHCRSMDWLVCFPLLFEKILSATFVSSQIAAHPVTLIPALSEFFTPFTFYFPIKYID